MSIIQARTAFVGNGSASFGLSQMFSVPAGISNPAYLVFSALDRNEYTAGASGATGSLSGNGHTLGLGGIGGDARGAGIVFTYQASSGRYYSSTYGYLDQLTYNASASLGDVTNLSLFGTSNMSLATSYAANAYGMMQLDAPGYLGSATVVTQPTFTASVPPQATPNSIVAAADSFVGKAWNMDGCWVLASTVAAEAGASLPVQSTAIGLPGQANSEWFTAFNGPSGQSGNWQSMVTAGEIIVIGTPGGGGHITTCVSGFGSTAMLVDNITYVSANGQIQNSAHDGSSSDIIVSAPHAASQEWAGVQQGSVVIYELDTPIVSAAVASDTLACFASQSLASLFTARDPANRAIASWQIYDTAAGDKLVLSGTAYSDHSAASAVTAASLASVSLLAGAIATTDTVEVRAFNGSFWGDWQSLTVTVAAAAVAPPALAAKTPNQTWVGGKAFSLALPATTFRDPQGQALRYAAHLSNGQALPGWLAFNAATDAFSGTAPVTAQTVGITVVATDGSGLSVSDSFSASVLGHSGGDDTDREPDLDRGQGDIARASSEYLHGSPEPEAHLHGQPIQRPGAADMADVQRDDRHVQRHRTEQRAESYRQGDGDRQQRSCCIGEVYRQRAGASRDQGIRADAESNLERRAKDRSRVAGEHIHRRTGPEDDIRRLPGERTERDIVAAFQSDDG